MGKKKKPEKKEADVHEDLKGFNIKIDSFGNIVSNRSIDELKSFLDKNVDDKKLKNVDKSEEE